MMRTAQGAVRGLERRQAAREKAQDAMRPATMERAGYWFRSVSVPEEPPQSPPAEAAEPVADLAHEADQYAIIYPRRAAQVRALGRLPNPCSYGPPSDELVHAIVTGTSPTLRALDAAASGAVSQTEQESNETHLIRLSAGRTAGR